MLTHLDAAHSISFGVAEARPGEGLQRLIIRADSDLLRAPNRGDQPELVRGRRGDQNVIQAHVRVVRAGLGLVIALVFLGGRLVLRRWASETPVEGLSAD